MPTSKKKAISKRATSKKATSAKPVAKKPATKLVEVGAIAPAFALLN